MFFRKKDKKWNKEDSSNLDKLVTWLIIWWAAASILWLSKTKKWKEITTWIKSNYQWFFNKWFSLFWKWLVKIISVFNKKK